MNIQNILLNHPTLGPLLKRQPNSKTASIRLKIWNAQLVRFMKRFYHVLTPDPNTLPYDLELSDFEIKIGRKSSIAVLSFATGENLEPLGNFARKIYLSDNLFKKSGKLSYLIKLAHFGISVGLEGEKRGAVRCLFPDNILVRFNKLIRYKTSQGQSRVRDQSQKRDHRNQSSLQNQRESAISKSSDQFPVHVDIKFVKLPDFERLLEFSEPVFQNIENERSYLTVFDSKKFNSSFEGKF